MLKNRSFIIKKIILFLACIFLQSTGQYVIAGFEFFGKDSCLEFIGEDSFLILESDLLNFNGTLKLPGNKISDNIKNLNKHSIGFSSGSIIINGQTKPTILTGKIGCKAQTRDNTSHNTSALILSGNQTLNFDNTPILESVEISGPHNIITGTPNLSEAIRLQDASSELMLNLQNKLSQNIILNGGSLVLLDDLVLKDNVTFEGEGSIDINGFRLAFPVNCPVPNLHHIIYTNANDIQLNGYTTLDGTWTFSGDGGYSTINGYGNVLDLSSGGSIVVCPNQTLYITAVDLKGLGDSVGTFSVDPTSTIKLSSSTLELCDNLTWPSGTLSIITPNCKLIIKDKHYFVLCGPNGTLEVDNVCLNYETLGNAPIYPPPFAIFPGGNINLLDAGEIVSTNFQTVNGEFQLYVPATKGINWIIGNVTMTTYTIVHFVNEDRATYKPMILDCTGKTIRYDTAENASVILDENVDLFVQNLIAYGLGFVKLDLQGTGTTKAKVHFGDNLYSHLIGDAIIDNTPWLISGNATIDANNYMITVTGSNGIIIDNNQNLTISNATLNLLNSNSLTLLGDNATLTLNNVTIKLGEDGWNFNTGNIIVSNYLYIVSQKKTCYSSPINFTSKGNFTIGSATDVYLDSILFEYMPTAISEEESLYSLKRRVTMNDDTSFLYLNNCVINTAPSGLAFDTGNLNITDQVAFSIPPTATTALEFGPTLQLTVNPSSIIEVDGPVIYGPQS